MIGLRTIAALALPAGAPALLLALPATTALAQVQIRVAEPGRANYSELHDGLREGTPAADTVLQIIRSKDPKVLWRRARAAIRGTDTWNAGLLALTRLAELRSPAYADSAAAMARQIRAGKVEGPPGQDVTDLLPALQAIRLERERATRGDAPVLAELLALVPTGRYGLGEAWVLGRLGAGAVDSLAARFLAAREIEPRIRYLTLLSFRTDTTLIPLLARVYAAPDSFGVPPRYAVRASDGLIWIGTRASLAALLEARQKAKARGVYDDPALARNEYSFLANDSAAVVARTGKWLTEWISELRP
jgi:hypothetical protein